MASIVLVSGGAGVFGPLGTFIAGHGSRTATEAALYSIDSSTLKETRRVRVTTPASFGSTTRRYPVVLVLDGILGKTENEIVIDLDVGVAFHRRHHHHMHHQKNHHWQWHHRAGSPPASSAVGC